MHDGSYGTASAHSDGGLCVAIRDGSAGAAELVSFPDGTKGAAAALNVGACWSCFCFLRLAKFFCPSAVVVSFWLRGAGVFLVAVFVVLAVFGAVAGAVAGGGFGFLIVFGCFVASGCV